MASTDRRFFYDILIEVAAWTVAGLTCHLLVMLDIPLWIPALVGSIMALGAIIYAAYMLQQHRRRHGAEAWNAASWVMIIVMITLIVGSIGGFIYTVISATPA